MNRDRALKALLREPADTIPHGEMIANPDFIQLATGIDPWEKPRSAQAALISRYALDTWALPPDDTPVPRVQEEEAQTDSEGRKRVRRGQELSWPWDWGRKFRNIEDVLKFSPLQDLDYSDMEPEKLDFGIGEEGLAQKFQAECKRILRDFPELSRMAFKALAQTDLEVLSIHDGICYQRGPVFSPKWLREDIYPYYEEFWGYLKAAGKTTFFISDGNVDNVVDDVSACGADAILCENYTGWKGFARNHPDKTLFSGGDNRIIRSGDEVAIRHMVREMAEIGREMPGYFFCVGNHITHNLPPAAVKCYFEAAEDYGQR